MGKRGPQPGWKQRKAEERAACAAAAAATAVDTPQAPQPQDPPAASTPSDAPAPAAPPPVVTLNGDQRNNPRYLSGQALRDFAHLRGVARSSMDGKSDEHIREQCRYLVARAIEEA